MKLLFFILFSVTAFAQSPFFLLFDEVASTPAPPAPSGDNIFVFTEGNAVDSSNPDCGAYEYDGSYLWLLLGLRRRKKYA